MTRSSHLNTRHGGRHSYDVEASWVGEVAAARLTAASVPGRVHSVYEGAINVICDAGMISFVKERVDRGPINVTLKLNGRTSLSSFKVQTGDALKRNGNFLLDIGGGLLTVSLRRAHLYVPPKDFQRPILGGRSLLKNIGVVRETALKLGRNGGLGELIPLIKDDGIEFSGESLNIFAATALPRLQTLLAAIGYSNCKGIERATQDLAGLGPGLTPSSDDVLLGLVLVTYLHARNARVDEEQTAAVIRAILSGARGRTTLQSQEYLSQAAQGNCNERVMRLCRELLTGNPESVEREAQQVMMIGETSGTDTMLGLLLGIQLLLNGGER